MKTNDRKELHHKTEKELQQMLVEAQKELVSAKLEYTRGKLKNTSSLANMRKTIAQISTVLRGKELTHGKNA